MTIGYILTAEQYNEIQGQYYTPYQFFNCVQDINGVWFFFASEQDIAEFEGTPYMWLFDLSQGEYTPPPPPLMPY